MRESDHQRTVHVRDATPDDAMAVFALHVAAPRHLPGDHYTEAQARDWADKRGEGPERYDTDDLLVAERDGGVVGFGEWTGGENNDSALERVGEVLACYVHLTTRDAGSARRCSPESTTNFARRNTNAWNSPRR